MAIVIMDKIREEDKRMKWEGYQKNREKLWRENVERIMNLIHIQ